MRIFYAHSKQIYETNQEEKEREFLKREFPKFTIICPNNDIGELNDFRKYLEIVDRCYMVIASEIDDHVGKGVFSEIARAFSNNAYVGVIREKDNDFSLSEVIGIQIINDRDWKIKYAKLIITN